MFTAGNGAYRRTKTVIDWINICIGVAVVIMATVIFIVPGNWDFLLPIVFMAGAVINMMHAVKFFLRYEGKRGAILLMFTIVLAVISIASAKVLW